jgi:hypothetical protein
MDISYAKIPTIDGDSITLFRKSYRRNHVEDPRKKEDPLVWQDERFKSYTIFAAERMVRSYTKGKWTMHFDGDSSKSGNGVGIMFSSPSYELTYYSFRLEFEATNNVVEYEALLLGSNIAKYLGIKMVHVIGDFDLVVCQVNGHHACKLERLKRYRSIILLAMKRFQ